MAEFPSSVRLAVDRPLSRAGLAETLDRVADVFRTALETDETDNGRSAVYLSRPLLTAVELAGAARAAAAAMRDNAGESDTGPEDTGPSLVSEVAQIAGDNFRDGHNAGWLACLAAYGFGGTPEKIPAPPAEILRMVHPGELGQIAYEEYARTVNGRSPVSGDVLPTWAELADADQDATGGKVYRAWVAAARKVLATVR